MRVKTVEILLCWRRLKTKKSYSGAWYLIEFIETQTRTIANGSNILKGKVKDLYYPRICGVGYVGEIESPSSHPLYSIWQNMLKRCYEQSHKNYNEYGGDGVYVDKRWHNFSNYVEDISKKYNYEKLIKDKKTWNIDKDKICKEMNIHPKIYSNETTIIITARENSSMREREYKQPYEKTGKGVHSRERYGGVQWCATIKNPNTGKNIKKYFSTNVHGSKAKDMAIKQRKEWEKEYGYGN